MLKYAVGFQRDLEAVTIMFHPLKLTIMTRKEQLVVNLWVMWCYNFHNPEKFINHICEKCGKMYLKDHLMEKFTHLYETFGCRSVMNDFYTEIDLDLREALVDYAINVYAPVGMKTMYEEYKSL